MHHHHLHPANNSSTDGIGLNTNLATIATLVTSNEEVAIQAPGVAPRVLTDPALALNWVNAPTNGQNGMVDLHVLRILLR